MDRFIAYYRVSTDQQGKSGLGLEAQRTAVTGYTNGGKLIAEFTEIESGKRNARPELEKALAACQTHKARLIIAKLDRLSRNLAFIATLMERKVDFLCCDNPHATKLTLHILAAIAEHEREMISDRTKKALAASTKKLGGYRGFMPTPEMRQMSAESRQRRSAARARDIAPTIKALQAAGAESLRAIAAGLDAAGIPTATGQGPWSAIQVQRYLGRL